MARVCVLILLLGGLATAIPSAGAQTDEDASCAEIEPLDVGLVIDRSGSMMGEPLDAAKEGAQRLVENMTIRDHTGLVSYDHQASLDKLLDADHQATWEAIDILHSGGSTATGDGIDVSHGDFSTNGRAEVRQVMIVLSDGYTNTGSDPVVQAEEAKLDGIEIHAIGLGNNVNRAELRAIASEPEERYFHQPNNANQLLEVFERITDSLTSSLGVSEAFVAEGQVAEPGGAHLTINKLGQERYPKGGNGSLFELPLTLGGLAVSFEAAATSAEGMQDAQGTSATASTGLTSLTIAEASTGRVLLSADGLIAESGSQATPTSASSSSGETALGAVDVDGHGRLEAPISPNTRLILPAMGEVVLNEQEASTGGNHSRLLVNVVRIHLEPTATDPAVDLVIGSAFSAASCDSDEQYTIPRKSPAEPIEEDLVPRLSPPRISTPGFWMLHDPFAPLPEETDHVNEGHPGVLEVRRDRSESSDGDESSSYDTTKLLLPPADASVEFTWRYEEGPSGWRLDAYEGSGVGTLTVCLSDVCTEGEVFAEDRETHYNSTTRETESTRHTLGAEAEDFGAEGERYESSESTETADESRDCSSAEAWAPFYLDTDADVTYCESRYETDGYDRNTQRVYADGEQWTGYGDSDNDVTIAQDDEEIRLFLDGRSYGNQDVGVIDVDFDEDRWVDADPENPRVEIETDVEIDLTTGESIDVEHSLDARDGEVVVTVELETPAGDFSQTVRLPP